MIRSLAKLLRLDRLEEVLKEERSRLRVEVLVEQRDELQQVLDDIDGRIENLVERPTRRRHRQKTRPDRAAPRVHEEKPHQVTPEKGVTAKAAQRPGQQRSAAGRVLDARSRKELLALDWSQQNYAIGPLLGLTANQVGDLRRLLRGKGHAIPHARRGRPPRTLRGPRPGAAEYDSAPPRRRRRRARKA